MSTLTFSAGRSAPSTPVFGRLLALLLVVGTALAEAYPVRPIRFITSDVGSGADVSARLLAQGISGPLGQQVIVDNRAGALVPELLAKAPADGYTLMLSGPVWILPMLRRDLAYDTQRDFSPITWVTSSPAILVVHPSLPVRSVRDLIALAKARRGELNYASAPSGSINHLAAELFKAMAGVTIVRVPYKGSGMAMNDLLGGQMHMMFAVASSAPEHVKAGRLRALAVSSAQRSALLPALPTIAEAGGLAGYEAIAITGVFAPAKTPEMIINRLHLENARALARPEFRQRFLNNGSEAVGGPPEQLIAAIKADMARWSKLIQDSGISDAQ